MSLSNDDLMAQSQRIVAKAWAADAFGAAPSDEDAGTVAVGNDNWGSWPSCQIGASSASQIGGISGGGRAVT